MRLRVMTDDQSAFLFAGDEVKAFATETRDGVYWGIMPRGPGGMASSAEVALRQIVDALEVGEDRGFAGREDVTETHLPPIRKRQLTFIGYFDVGTPESGTRAIARKLGWIFGKDDYVVTKSDVGIVYAAYGPFSSSKADEVARLLRVPGFRNEVQRLTSTQLRNMRVPVIHLERVRTTAFEQERAEMKAWLDARSPFQSGVAKAAAKAVAARVVSEGRYKVAYLGSTLGSGASARGAGNTWRSYLNGDFPLVEAIRQMDRVKRRGMTAWVEDTSGNHVPVRGAMRRPTDGR